MQNLEQAKLLESTRSAHRPRQVRGSTGEDWSRRHLETQDNYRRERIEFEVVDWPSQYHAILGRPAFARFMDIPGGPGPAHPGSNPGYQGGNEPHGYPGGYNGSAPGGYNRQ